eukprot:TRINITY_DN21313_c0_g1_i1.p1 TRINITY_DN21313_c0_g1~~TRINITY_DN21313_c0_g1_i1.p1  ORF type:complete len:244 (+),score=48.01 TRINITY_DN21313_c0_g1_i1:46-732(+)
MRSARAAVVLTGSGVYDGSEIGEAIATFIALGKYDAKIKCFAPDKNQMHVVNHTNGEEQAGETRNQISEANRIARGGVLPLTELRSGDFDALFIPGGFGVAKNLSNFAVAGADMKADPEIERVLREFHASKTPIGACCIAPVLLAKILGEHKINITLGKPDWPYGGSIEAAESFGAVNHPNDLKEIVVDEANRIVTSPAFMKGDANHYDVYKDIKLMVASTLSLCKQA